MRRYQCCNCGNIFNGSEIQEVQESRGEFWGMPAYETMYYSPCCTDSVVEVVADDVYDTPIIAYEYYYQFGEDLVAEENLEAYLDEHKAFAREKL